MTLARLAGLAAAAALALFAPAAGVADTAPSITVVTTGTSGTNGWFTSNVTVKFTVSGETSTQGCDTVTLSAEGVNASLTCTAFGADGATATAKPVIKIDKTPPAVTAAAPTRGPDANGWYRAPLSVTFSGADAVSGIAGCSTVPYSGPDTAGTVLSGTCTDAAGLVAAAGFGLKYDATPPEVDAAPERPPDANGWYNRPITLTVGGRDGLSGLDGCGAGSYGGPDTPNASIVAQCRDAAGNTASKSVGIRYDATPPTVADLAVRPGNRQATLTWNQSADVAAVTVTRAAGKGAPAAVYRGKERSFVDRGLRNGIRYRYTVTAQDEAANAATASADTVVRATINPPDGARIRRPPVLVWHPLSGASYYNVQVFKGRTKVLSTWPKAPRLKLGRTWKYNGRTFKLTPGRYRWYIWPGFGPRKQARFGTMLGGSFFVYVR